MSLREALGRRGRAAFIPYIAAGDPTLSRTGELVDALASAGADLIELGVPFSDPIADGPVNQRAAERALKGGTTLSTVLDFAAGLRRRGQKVPLLAFTYYNPVLRMGLSRFAARLKDAGIEGALVVDLPPEEAAEYRAAMAAEGRETVFLASPTSEDSRLRAIGEASTGFVYYVSRLGVTGESASVSATLETELARVRKAVGRPVAVGFGLSTPEQVRAASRGADAVVVGSALVRLAEESGAHAPARIKELASRMIAALEERLTC